MKSQMIENLGSAAGLMLFTVVVYALNVEFHLFAR